MESRVGRSWRNFGPISRPQFSPGPRRGCRCPQGGFLLRCWVAALTATAADKERGAGGTTEEPRTTAPLLNFTERRAKCLRGASWGFLRIPLHSPNSVPLAHPGYAGNGKMPPAPRSQPQPQSCCLLLEPPSARRRRPAANGRHPNPAFGVSAGLSSRKGRARAQGGRATWAPGPRRGGPAAAPRTRAAPNPKHTRTHARARWPIHSPGGVGRRFHSSSFITQRRGFLHPDASIPPSPGPPRGSIAPRVLASRTHTPTPLRSSTIASVAPAPRPLPPRLPAAAAAQRRSDLPRSARRAQLAGDATAEKRRQLPSPAASGATARSWAGAGAEGREEGGGGGEQKFRPLWARPRPRLLPRAPPRCPLPEPGPTGVGACPRRPHPGSATQRGGGTGAGGRQAAPSRTRGERSGCPLTCPGLRLETSPKCAGELSIWLGEFPTPPTSPQRALTR